MVTDFFAGFLLYFLNHNFIFPFVIFLYYFTQDLSFVRSAIIALFAMSVNAYLKQYWAVPLNPEIGKIGWAYPSGHTTMNVVFWGSLILQFPSLRFLFAVCILLFAGCSTMVWVGYHDWLDIMGGVRLGLLLLIPFRYYVALKHKFPIYSIFLLLAILSIGITFALPNYNTQQYNWLWRIQGIMTGITISIFMLHLKYKHFIPSKRMASVNFVTALLALFFITNFYITDTNAITSIFSAGLLLSLTIFSIIPLMDKTLIKGFKLIKNN
jgi:hypothetical protein